jgi:hypothetical protein
MAELARAASRALFQLKWLFWTPEKRYVYLWNRTCRK